MKQVTKRSIKLYSELTPKQQAALAFNYLAEQNGKEAEKVHEAVAWHNGQFKDASYSLWRDRFIQICLIVGLEYWRISSYKNQAMICIAETDNLTNEKIMIDAARAGFARLVSLKLVLKTICAENNFSYKASLKFANIPDTDVIDSFIEPDLDFYAAWYEELLECLPA